MLGTFVWVIHLIFMLLYGVDICERDNLTYEFDNKERRKEQIFGLDPDIYKPLSCILGMNIATTGCTLCSSLSDLEAYEHEKAQAFV